MAMSEFTFREGNKIYKCKAYYQYDKKSINSMELPGFGKILVIQSPVIGEDYAIIAKGKNYKPENEYDLFYKYDFAAGVCEIINGNDSMLEYIPRLKNMHNSEALCLAMDYVINLINQCESYDEYYDIVDTIIKEGIRWIHRNYKIGMSLLTIASCVGYNDENIDGIGMPSLERCLKAWNSVDKKYKKTGIINVYMGWCRYKHHCRMKSEQSGESRKERNI